MATTFNQYTAPFLTLRDSVAPPLPTLTTAKKKTLTNLEIDANFIAMAEAIQNATPVAPVPVVVGIPIGTVGSSVWSVASPGTDYVAPGTLTNFTVSQRPSILIANNGTGDNIESWDGSLYQVMQLTFGTDNISSFNFYNGVTGCFYFLYLKQDSFGNRAVGWSSVFKWPTATAPTLSIAGGAVDLLTFYYDGTNLMCTGISLGVA